MHVHVFTEEDFKIFVNYIRHFTEKLNLTDWNIEFEHSQIGDGVSATCWYDTQSRSCLFKLTRSTEGDYNLNTNVAKIALHEVLHLLLGNLLHIAAVTQDDTKGLTLSEEHAVINKLLKFMEY